MKSLSSKSNVSIEDTVVAGAISGLLTRFCIAPLDLIKIRLQLSGVPSTPQNTRRTVSSIAKNEGLRAFWKGNTPAGALYVTYNVAQFFSLRAVNMLLNKNRLTSELTEPTKQFLSGGTSGLVSTFATYPFDLVRTRLAANPTKDRVLLATIGKAWKQDGFRGFYHGLGASLISIFPYMGIFFSGYSILREALASPAAPSWLPQIFPASALAAAAGKTAVFPIDTIRKRIQVSSMHTPAAGSAGHLYPRTFLKCGAHIIRNEGFRTLYNGLTIAIMKAVPVSFLTVYFYENALTLIGAKHPKPT